MLALQSDPGRVSKPAHRLREKVSWAGLAEEGQEQEDSNADEDSRLQEKDSQTTQEEPSLHVQGEETWGLIHHDRACVAKLPRPQLRWHCPYPRLFLLS